jgi:hypothetical protein
MSEEQDEIDNIKSKLNYIEARLVENRKRLDELKTNITFWNMIVQDFDFKKEEEEETND